MMRRRRTTCQTRLVCLSSSRLPTVNRLLSFPQLGESSIAAICCFNTIPNIKPFFFTGLSYFPLTDAPISTVVGKLPHCCNSIQNIAKAKLEISSQHPSVKNLQVNPHRSTGLGISIGYLLPMLFYQRGQRRTAVLLTANNCQVGGFAQLLRRLHKCLTVVARRGAQLTVIQLSVGPTLMHHPVEDKYNPGCGL